MAPDPTKCPHPTAKPDTLMRLLAEAYAREGGLVVDPFCGSGSTGVGAMAAQRRFVGGDLDASYVEYARRRLAEAAETLWTHTHTHTPMLD